MMTEPPPSCPSKLIPYRAAVHWITQPSAPAAGSQRGGKSSGAWRVGGQPHVPPRTFSVMQQRRYLDFQAFSTSYVFGNSKIVVASRPVKLRSIGNKKPSLKSAALNSMGFGFSSCWSVSELTKGRTSSFVYGSSRLFSQPPVSTRFCSGGPHQTLPFVKKFLRIA